MKLDEDLNAKTVLAHKIFSFVCDILILSRPLCQFLQSTTEIGCFASSASTNITADSEVGGTLVLCYIVTSIS